MDSCWHTPHTAWQVPQSLPINPLFWRTCNKSRGSPQNSGRRQNSRNRQRSDEHTGGAPPRQEGTYLWPNRTSREPSVIQSGAPLKQRTHSPTKNYAEGTRRAETRSGDKFANRTTPTHVNHRIASWSTNQTINKPFLPTISDFHIKQKLNLVKQGKKTPTSALKPQ